MKFLDPRMCFDIVKNFNVFVTSVKNPLINKLFSDVKNWNQIFTYVNLDV